MIQQTTVVNGIEYDYITLDHNREQTIELLSYGGDVLARLELNHDLEQGTFIQFFEGDDQRSSSVNYFEMNEWTDVERVQWMANVLE